MILTQVWLAHSAESEVFSCKGNLDRHQRSETCLPNSGEDSTAFLQIPREISIDVDISEIIDSIENRTHRFLLAQKSATYVKDIYPLIFLENPDQLKKRFGENLPLKNSQSLLREFIKGSKEKTVKLLKNIVLKMGNKTWDLSKYSRPPDHSFIVTDEVTFYSVKIREEVFDIN